MWLDAAGLGALGLASYGQDVRIDESVRFSGAGHIHVGSNVRIDAFCDLSAGPGTLKIGSFVHLGHGVCVYAAAGVQLDDYSGLSSGVMVFSESDDYRGRALTNPTLPAEYRSVRRSKIHLERHAVVGAGSVVLPGVNMRVGSAAGALTLLAADVGQFEIVSGNPSKVVGMRNAERMLALEAEHRISLKSDHDGSRE